MVIAHFLYVVFVVTGGLLALKWPWIIRLHLPAALWGAFIEFSGLICPLTALENWLRVEAGAGWYKLDFIGRYLFPLLYPASLTREIQISLGIIVVGFNIALYSLVWRWRSKARCL